MRPIVVSLPLLLAVCGSLAHDLAAQRGGRFPRRSEAVQERVGAFFVDAALNAAPTVPEGEKRPDLLAGLSIAKLAANAGCRTVLYLYDSHGDAEALRQFERALFQDDLGIALRFFSCQRLDVSGAHAAPLHERYAAELPLFAVYDIDGELVGVESMAGYKPGGSDLERLLGKAVGKESKVPLQTFVKKYRAVVRDLEQVEQKRSQIDERDRKVKADDVQKRKEIERDRKELQGREDKVMAEERELLEKAALPPRPEGAVRLGGFGRGGGRGGRDGGDGGQDPGGGGRDPGGRDPGGRDPGGRDPGGR